MLRTLIFLRHAKSSWTAPAMSDHDRTLNARGREACVRMARVFADIPISPDIVLCSSAVRTRETLERLRPALPDPLSVIFDEDLYLASPKTILAKLRGLDDRYRDVLVIGHYPGMPDCALTLTGEDASGKRQELALKFPTAALARLTLDVATWRDLKPACGVMTHFIRPRDVEE